MSPSYIAMTMTTFLLLLISGTEAVITKQTIIKQFLATHNAARSTVGVQPLTWDARLARYAKQYANQRRWDCALQHSNGPYGENIFWGGGSEWTPAEVVEFWVSEQKWYNYSSNSCAQGQICGHYTQVVWKTTRRVGCAKVACFGGRGVFMTCNYDPPGNYNGQWPY
ncbi:pathogenesis-related protein PR-1-like [Cornus florida]|uniref:pathogenesis-related protein PR-1-like n=1 Tax=Cornus florida TaxID=4283 RepID=UPI00289C9CF9|nr:pathogenesis-related protein PR-1-like [Cornus florida]